MLTIKINSITFIIKSQISILEACNFVGIQIPRFCFHSLLSVAGNCRMCLVELENLEKPVASCVTEIEENMSIWTDSPFVKKARENVLEILLLNHPLDCPICDQAGECDLQDQTKLFGMDYTRFFLTKRTVSNKFCGSLIKTIMRRCIHCTRCVRYSEEIAGSYTFGTLSRGSKTEIGGYFSNIFESEISGNVIDLCPVGALTSRPYAFKTRPWELRLAETIDLTNSLGANIYVNFKESEIFRVLPRNNNFLNLNLIDDKTRFSYDAINNNRISNNFFLSPLNTHQKFSFEKLIDKIKLILKNQSKILILINEEIDFETAILLKHLKNVYLDKLSIININKNYKKNFCVTHKNFSSEKNLDSCILLSSNLKLENAILNVKLKLYIKNNKINFFNLGNFYASNLPLTFINLNIFYILSILEGKNLISKIFYNSISTLFIIGESLFSRINNIGELMDKFILLNNNFNYIKIEKACNSKGLNSLFLEPLKNTLFKTNPIVIALNLDDNLFIRKLYQKFYLNFIWVNTHGSQLALKSSFILSTLNEFEEENLYLNLYGLPQKTNKILKLSSYITNPIRTILKAIFSFNKKVDNNRFPEFYFVYELLNNSNLFYSLKSSYLSNNQINKINISYYPLKSVIENFFNNTKFVKNSNIMTNCSILNRNKNFS